MSWCAYVDESEPPLQSGSSVYLLAAALVEQDDCETARDTALTLRLRGQRKLHRHDEAPARRRKLVEAVAQLACPHLIVVRSGPDTHSERRRALCLTRLLVELDQRGIAEICLEARERRQNARDLRVLSGLRAQQRIGTGLRMRHEPGPENPLLWVADIVAAAASASHLGDSSYLDQLGDLATIMEA